MRTLSLAVVLLGASSPALGAAFSAETPGRSDDRSGARVGERAKDRMVVVVMCIVYTFLLATVQGYRFGRVACSKPETKVSDVLVFTQGFVSIAFILAIGVKSAVLGAETDSQCHGAIWLCIGLYGASKMVLYLFLLERIHIVRAPFVDRRRDSIYLMGTIATVAPFSVILGYEFKDPIAELSSKTGQCRIGLQPYAAIAIMVFDIITNILLTAIFAWQLRPALKAADPPRTSWHTHGARGEREQASLLSSIRCIFRVGRADSGRMSMRSNIRIMLVRNVVGSSLILLVTAANNIIYLAWRSAILSHICLLMCMTDVVLCMLITNWLTMRYPRDNADSQCPFTFTMPDLPYDGTCNPRYAASSRPSNHSRIDEGGERSLQLAPQVEYPPNVNARDSKMLHASLRLDTH
ncbi:hypothetical protein IAQ61_001187 [Plenodomus lingam]|uniref:Uncharacterized protein n=1 Tax=Leptosphaeria maculans (strain JN3 / isolate v23.1.3 / race Av1-4-5-6-7-8) TaxID=985895 RepID=E5A1N5_LEPMJ|nr:hypothetical protein LEMA_P090110.1 [Plenodomus lingam JN3]KAH9880893.1 hypothetical protein IAQ61_001187 [Plenodomus lingam]CBX97602.1 hypothetical protein LEMA_P090110.1 [Plenodomus lingam JN3]